MLTIISIFAIIGSLVISELVLVYMNYREAKKQPADLPKYTKAA